MRISGWSSDVCSSDLRLVCAVDCGLAVNPDTIEAQTQGGAIFGLTAALHGNITFADGRVEQGNFDTYLPMRIDEVPVIETHLVESAAAPGGIGDAATAAVSPAVATAIRSEERRVGKEWVSTGRSRWST